MADAIFRQIQMLQFDICVQMFNRL